MKILVINGPNLNLLGQREPEIYGTTSFETFFSALKELFTEIELTYFQSNHEGALIDKLHDCIDQIDGVVLNAGGYTHTSVALADAVAAVKIPVVEVHISNLHKREGFRQKTLLGSVCVGSITGFGMDGYRLAVEALRMLIKK